MAEGNQSSVRAICSDPCPGPKRLTKPTSSRCAAGENGTTMVPVLLACTGNRTRKGREQSEWRQWQGLVAAAQGPVAAAVAGDRACLLSRLCRFDGPAGAISAQGGVSEGRQPGERGFASFEGLGPCGWLAANDRPLINEPQGPAIVCSKLVGPCTLC